jgi:hypothetical protein
MMQATTSLFLALPVMTCLPVQFRFLTTSEYLSHGEFPVASVNMLATHTGITNRCA